MATRKWNLKQILTQMKKFRNPSDYNGRMRRVLDFRVEAAVGVKQIAYVGRVSSSSRPFNNVRIQFGNIEFSKEQKPGMLPVEVRNKLWYYSVPTFKSPVKLKSSSDSFRFEFEKQLFDRKAMIGNWRRYKRKTPPSKRPAKPPLVNPLGYDFKNPKNVAGIDVTLYSFLQFLVKKKLVKET